MKFEKILSKLGPVVAMAFAVATSGCDGINMNVGGNDFDGKPLSELDLTDASPSAVGLYGPDTVKIVEGDEFAVTVDGSEQAAARLRFELDGDSFNIGREKGNWSDSGRATIKIVMPAVSGLTMAGSGTIESAALSGAASLAMLGSGTLDVARVAADSLEIAIAGSGNVKAAGASDTLELSIMGSGSGDLANLKAGEAEVTIMGSGDAAFASDGKVDASIMGSGNVTVRGNAACEVSAMGSGKLRCEAGGTAAETDPPKAPDTPDA